MKRRHVAITLAIAASAIVPASASAGTSNSPATLAFPSQEVGVASAGKTVTVSVTCDFPGGGILPPCLSDGSFTPAPAFSGANPGDFSQTNTCGAGIESDGGDPGTTTCVFTVTFKPTAAGSRAATLTLGGGGIFNPLPLTVGLTGTATPAVVKTNPVTTTPVTTPAAKKCKKKGKKAGAAAKRCKKKKR